MYTPKVLRNALHAPPRTLESSTGGRGEGAELRVQAAPKVVPGVDMPRGGDGEPETGVAESGGVPGRRRARGASHGAGCDPPAAEVVRRSAVATRLTPTGAVRLSTRDESVASDITCTPQKAIRRRQGTAKPGQGPESAVVGQHTRSALSDNLCRCGEANAIKELKLEL